MTRVIRYVELYCGLVLVCLLASGFSALASSVEIKAIPTKVDLGVFDQGAEVSWSFEIGNEGKATAKIDDLRPFCGCTVVKNFDTVLHPGQRIRISGTFKANDMPPGGFQKGIRVWWSAGGESREMAPILLTGEVRSIVSPILGL